MAKKATKKATKKKVAKKASTAKPMTKSEILNALSEKTGLTRKDVSNVLDELGNVIHQHLKPRGVGVFSLPGLCKMKVNSRPATKARPGVNPFTGEEIMIAAKPARKVVKITPLKNLKEMAESAPAKR